MRDYARDRLSSITGLTDSTGALTDSYRYDPWGGNLASSGSSGNPLRYIGGYLDGSSGLYLLGLRYYQPSAGRFTQLDPHPKQLLSVNRYAYSGCNPVNYSDPSGLDVVSDCIGAAVVGGVIGMIAGALGAAGLAALPFIEATLVQLVAAGALEGAIVGMVTGCLAALAHALGFM